MRHLKQTLAFAAAMVLCACNVEPDMSNRFTFTGQTVTDFLLSNDSIFSSFNYILRRSGQDRILSSYGNYTCFAPKNGAVEAYIDSLWNDRESVDEDGNLLHNGLTDNSLEGLTDSLCTDIAMYHLMKTELTTTQMLTAGGATYRTMLGRFITAGGRGSQILVNEGAPIDRQMCDNKVENGIVHAIGRCIPRSNRMVVQELKADSAHFAIFYEALCATGIDALLAEDDKQLSAPWPAATAWLHGGRRRRARGGLRRGARGLAASGFRPFVRFVAGKFISLHGRQPSQWLPPMQPMTVKPCATTN